jgi:hypothetical protein
MQQQLKKYFSVIFLWLFLVPMVEQEIHAFEHQQDVHCNATDKHFHELEHTCSICDFTYTSSNYLADNNFQSIISVQQFYYSPFIKSVNTPLSLSLLPARAPPVI